MIKTIFTIIIACVLGYLAFVYGAEIGEKTVHAIMGNPS